MNRPSDLLRIHATYHKCLTMYFIKVMHNTFNKSFLKRKEQYHHFESIEGVFYNRIHKYKVASTSGFAIEPERLSGPYRITRFIRDPRDLVISGYFYHKRGAEPWFRMKNPTNRYWEPINAKVPAAMPSDLSYAEYLNELDFEQGIKAEMEFRQYHFESMMSWDSNEHIRLFRYEEILGNEEKTFGELADHLEFTQSQKRKIRYYAKKHAFKSNVKNSHIRNPKPKQWADYFTPELKKNFNQQYGNLLEKYQYSHQ